MESANNYKNFKSISISIAPSGVFNNLTLSKEKLTYISNAEPAARCPLLENQILLEGAGASSTTIKYKELSDVWLIKMVSIDNVWHILLGLNGSLQIWNYNGTRILTHITPRERSESDYPLLFNSGCSFKPKSETTPCICCANTYGEIYCIKILKSKYTKELVYGNSTLIPPGAATAPSADAATPATTAGGSARMHFTCMCADNQNGLLICGCADGSVVLLEGRSPVEFIYNSMLAHSLAIPLVCMDVLYRGASMLVCGYASGEIKLFALPEGRNVVGFCAHSRIITALMCHPSKSLFVSVGEDSFLNVFEIAGEEDHYDVDLVLSSKVDNSLLTGVSFIPPNYSSIVANAYDTNMLYVWKDVV